jgi:hypothetical protein
MNKITALILVVVLALLGGCAGCVYLGYQSIMAAKAELDPLVAGFEARWNAADIPGLYALLEAKDQGIDEARFSAEIGVRRDHAGRITATTMRGFHANRTPSGTSATMIHDLTCEHGTLHLTLTLTKDGRWKVIGFALTEDLGSK